MSRIIRVFYLDTHDRYAFLLPKHLVVKFYWCSAETLR